MAFYHADEWYSTDFQTHKLCFHLNAVKTKKVSHLLIIEDFILFIKKRFEEINKEKKSEMKCFLIPGIKGVAGKRSLASSYQNISHWQEPKTPFGQNHNSEPRNTSTWHSAGLILYSRAKARIGRSRDIHSSSNPSRGISTGQD